MGSKQVREAHMMRYGATSSSLEGATTIDQLPTAERKERIQHSVDRLSKPRVKPQSTNQVGRIGTKAQIKVAGDLFPTLKEGDDGSDGGTPRYAPYPEDWRLLPKSSSVTQPLVWVYGNITLQREADAEEAAKQAEQLVEKLLTDHRVPMIDELTSKRDVREMLRTPQRYGVLVDIVATRRNVLTGAPHALATRIYEFVEEKYPVLVKFVFVGITDNGTKRVARDVFKASRSRHAPGVNFSHIDGEHMYVVHPKGDEAGQMKSRGDEEQAEREAEHIRRHCTPKFVPPPPPEWLKQVEKRQSSRPPSSSSRPPSRSNASAFNSTMNRTVELECCNRCWLFGRERSPSPTLSQSRSRPTSMTPDALAKKAEASIRPTSGQGEDSMWDFGGTSPSFSPGPESARRPTRRYRHRRTMKSIDAPDVVFAQELRSENVFHEVASRIRDRSRPQANPTPPLRQ